MVKEEINLIHGKVTFNQEQIKAINEMKVVFKNEAQKDLLIEIINKTDWSNGEILEFINCKLKSIGK